VLNFNWSVYIHINTINNKIYIGITSKEPQKRWKRGHGYSKDQSRFFNAIKKYGWNNFYHEVVASNLTEEEAKSFEKLLILTLDAKNPDKGYNLTDGGDGCTGYRRTDEQKQESSSRMKGKYSGEKNPMYGTISPMRGRCGELHHNHGKSMSEEQKQKISSALSGENNPMWGKHYLGEENPNSKLSDQDVTNIKYMIREGRSTKEIMSRYNVSKYTVSNIRLGKSWRHINVEGSEDCVS